MLPASAGAQNFRATELGGADPTRGIDLLPRWLPTELRNGMDSPWASFPYFTRP